MRDHLGDQDGIAVDDLERRDGRVRLVRKAAEIGNGDEGRPSAQHPEVSLAAMEVHAAQHVGRRSATGLPARMATQSSSAWADPRHSSVKDPRRSAKVDASSIGAGHPDRRQSDPTPPNLSQDGG